MQVIETRFLYRERGTVNETGFFTGGRAHAVSDAATPAYGKYTILPDPFVALEQTRDPK
jgi:hypothetical protein